MQTALLRNDEVRGHSFQALKDQEESHYLSNLPTTLTLPDTAVDRLRAAAGKIVLASPEFQRLLRETDARFTAERVPAEGSPPSASVGAHEAAATAGGGE